MRKILAMILLLVMLASLVACGDGKETLNNKDSKSSKENTTSDTIIEADPTGNETNNAPPSAGNNGVNSGDGSNSSNGAQHSHTYKKVVIAPTCEKDGFTSYSCDCGAQYTEDTILAKGHNFDSWVEKKAATETATGKEERKCKKCDKIESRDIPKIIKGHTHSYTESITKKPTCQSEGIKTFACSCGAKYTETIGVTAHNYTTEVVKPTCTKAGYTKYTCSCGKTYYDDTVKATDHKYNEKVTSATCTKAGYTAYTCKTCGYSYTSNYTNPKGHNYTDTVIKPTCTKAGYTTHVCKTCGDTYTDSNKNALGHSWSSWTTITPAEVGKAGQEKRTCSLCNESETQTIPALKEDTTKKWFLAQYNLAKTQYINSLERSKISKQDEITNLKSKIDYELDKYTDKRIDILNRYPPSATRDVMLTNAQQNYAAAIKPYKDKISGLESEIAAIDTELANPNVDSILAIVTQNSNISSQEVYNYYYKYSDSIT